MKYIKTHTLRFCLILMILVTQLSFVAAQTPFSVGVRGGVNTSNITEQRLYSGSLDLHNSTWKRGFFIGAVVDIPLSGKFSLSPGFFYDRRTSDFTSSYVHNELIGDEFISIPVYAEGTTTTNWFHVPMLVSFKFFPIKQFGINLDLGPYIAIGISGKSEFKNITYQNTDPIVEIPHDDRNCFKGEDCMYFNTDWGFKAGGGLVFFSHIYVGAHYLFGLRNLAKNKQLVSKSHTREWQFTVGYNF